ncbi:MAG: metallophosphoesterase [Bdellovibrionales bacterium]|nr:metallophosphoesterase [Bdellovibrionales bacterium]
MAEIENTLDLHEEVDFEKAEYTAILSDLHLCEAEPPNKRHPLWKKFKTREFFFDHEFKKFLEFIHEKANGKSIELILNGDIFDFDSVTRLPEAPSYHVSWLETRRGLDPEREKSVFKMEVILGDHPEWVNALSWFIKEGHRVIFVIGNHDLELHWTDVQRKILDSLELDNFQRRHVRFVEFFYVSNKDTLIEHGHQYDPYCSMRDPINPIVIDYNRLLIRMPFGDLVSRYIANGMGFFNPHVDANMTMTAAQFVGVFFKYMAIAQPLIVWTWFWTCITTFVQTLKHGTHKELQNPLTTEDRIEAIAKKANATSRMVRELRGLCPRPISESPRRVLKELWLDRVFLLLLSLLGLLYLFLLVDKIYGLSFYWLFFPLLLFLPPYVLYSRSVYSYVHHYKKPDEEILTAAGMITSTKRIVYGHTHFIRHEMIGPIEHLNPGTWSPAFLDVECTQREGQQAFVWITPSANEGEGRKAQLMYMEKDVFPSPAPQDSPPN